MPDAQPEAKAPDNPPAEQSGPKQDGGSGGSDRGQKLPRWPFVLAGLAVAAFVAFVLVRVFAPHSDVWTDDAYVRVHYAMISPRVSGQVTAVLVDDNQLVKAGDELVTLDDRDYATAVARREAMLARDSAQVNDAAANVARQPALITEQEAELASAQARLGFAQSDQRRYGNLALTGAGTAQQRQQADTALRQSQASSQSAEAALEASRRQLDVLKAQRTASDATVEADKAQLAQDRLNLSYTRIVAPLDGMVGQRNVQTGNWVSPGTTLMIVMPLDQVYIEANYREVDLRHVARGQHVTIHVDAYDIELEGAVDSVPPASGAALAPIAPNNATGNFTKIVQRLPVKILVSPNQPDAKLLRVGLSVETTIHTRLQNVAGEQSNAPGLLNAH